MKTALIIVRDGQFFAWNTEEAESIETAGKEFFGTLDCGGNIWDTEDGDVPEEHTTHSYEVVTFMDVTGWSHESVEAMYRHVKTMTLKNIVGEVLAI